MEHTSDKEFEAANRRGAERLQKFPPAISARYDRRIGRIMIELSTGIALSFKPHDAQGLEASKPDDLVDIEISPSGHGLYFPSLDVDIDVPALMDGFLGSKGWMAARLGAAGGRSATEAKASASRSNGRLGGRPKKESAELETA